MAQTVARPPSENFIWVGQSHRHDVQHKPSNSQSSYRHYQPAPLGPSSQKVGPQAHGHPTAQQSRPYQTPYQKPPPSQQARDAPLSSAAMNVLDQALFNMTKADKCHIFIRTMAEVGEELLHYATASFLDKAMEVRLTTISAKDLVIMLSKMQRLGFDQDDVVENEAVIGAGQTGAAVRQEPERRAAQTQPSESTRTQPHPIDKHQDGQALKEHHEQLEAQRIDNALREHQEQQKQRNHQSSASTIAQPASTPEVVDLTTSANHNTPTTKLSVRPRDDSDHNPRKQWRCHLCGKGFTAKAGLAYHVDKGVCKREADKPAEKSAYSCPSCEKGFVTVAGLKSHRMNNVCGNHETAAATPVPTSNPRPAQQPDYEEISGLGTPHKDRAPPASYQDPTSRPSNGFTPVQYHQAHMDAVKSDSQPSPSSQVAAAAGLSAEDRAEMDFQLAEQAKSHEAVLAALDERDPNFLDLRNKAKASDAAKRCYIRKRFGVMLRPSMAGPRGKRVSSGLNGQNADDDGSGRDSTMSGAEDDVGGMSRLAKFRASSHQEGSGIKRRRIHNLSGTTQDNFPSTQREEAWKNMGSTSSPLSHGSTTMDIDDDIATRVKDIQDRNKGSTDLTARPRVPINPNTQAQWVALQPSSFTAVNSAISRSPATTSTPVVRAVPGTSEDSASATPPVSSNVQHHKNDALDLTQPSETTPPISTDKEQEIMRAATATDRQVTTHKHQHSNNINGHRSPSSSSSEGEQDIPARVPSLLASATAALAAMPPSSSLPVVDEERGPSRSDSDQAGSWRS